MKHARFLPASIFIAIASIGCSRDDADLAEAPDGSDEQSASDAADEQSDAAGQTAPRAADAVPASEAGSAEETAREYLERRAAAAGAADAADAAGGAGEIEADAVGAVVVCSVCHGGEGEGNAALNAPRIGGMEEWYLARQLKYFKQGIRAATPADIHGTQMRAIALTLENDAVIEDLAGYLAGLNPPSGPALTSGDAERGEELYAVCAACHGEDGRGNVDLNTPSMVGQDGGYLVRQLENYRSGVRGSHASDVFGQQMRPIVESTLKTEDDVVDVVSYIATLGASEARSSSDEAD